jgi:hypothetical protein
MPDLTPLSWSRPLGPRTPPAIWLAAAALALGALALAGPRLVASDAPRRWTVLVDASPSMALAQGDGGSRARVAATAAGAWLAEHAGARDRVRWSRAGRAPLDLAPGELPPSTWLAAERSERAGPRFELEDRAGTLWVTDRAPEPPPIRAGCFASGGEAVPGPVAELPGARLVWDGTELAEVPAPEGDAVRLVSEREPPAPLLRVFNAWASARGFTPTRGAAVADEARLTLELLDLSPGRTVTVGRDGWLAGATACPLPSPTVERATVRWLTARDATGEELTVVDHAPGLVRAGLPALAEPTGDPAAFVVSWSELFDRALLPPPDVVALGERMAAGPAADVAPRAAAPSLDPNAEEPASAPLATWLALASAVLATLALTRRG